MALMLSIPNLLLASSLLCPHNEGAYLELAGLDLFTSVKYGCHGDCDYLSVDNALYMAEANLWPLVSAPSGSVHRAPCGSLITCDPLMARESRCEITLNDCASPEQGTLETLILDCLGDISCKVEGLQPNLCCSVIGSRK